MVYYWIDFYGPMIVNKTRSKFDPWCDVVLYNKNMFGQCTSVHLLSEVNWNSLNLSIKFGITFGVTFDITGHRDSKNLNF